MSDVPVGSLKGVTVNGEPVVLANLEGQIFALQGVCTHRAGPLAEGKLVEGDVMCPWHGARFDVRTGEPHGRFGTVPVRTYDVQIQGADILVKPAE